MTPPWPPVAALARGAAAPRLLERLRALPDERLAAISGVASDALVLVLGAELPWVEGLEWLGRHPDAPALLLPTARETSGPLDLLEAAVLRKVGAGPVAVLPDLLVPAAAALPLDRALLGAPPG